MRSPPPLRRPARPRAGFTLVELLVVIGIIALLISVLLPTLSRTRAAARQGVCASNLRQIGAGQLLYAKANRGRLPAVCDEWFVGGTYHNGGGIWPLFLVPYIVHDDRLAPTVGWQGLPNEVLSEQKEDTVLVCPSRPEGLFQNDGYNRWILGGYGQNRFLPPNDTPGGNWQSQYRGYPRLTSVRDPSGVVLNADGRGSSGDLGGGWEMNKDAFDPLHYTFDHQRHLGSGDPDRYRDMSKAEVELSQGKHSVGGANIAWIDGHVSFLDSWSAYTRVRGNVAGNPYDKILLAE